METQIRNTLVEETLKGKEEQKDIVQDVIEKVYPHIVTNLGPSDYREEIPRVEVWNDIYARYSGIPEMRGEDSKKTKAEWKDKDNTIYVYYLNMEDIEDIIRSLLHEYTHSLQDPDEEKREEQRKLGYDDDPHEIEAHAAEETWKDYLKYLEDSLIEEQTNPTSPESTNNGFTQHLVNYLKYVLTVNNPHGFKQFEEVVANDFQGGLYGYSASLYLTLLANVDFFNTGGGNEGIMTLLKDIPYQKYKIPNLYEYYIEYKGQYERWSDTEECIEESPSYAYGESSQEECECWSYEEIYVPNPVGEEGEEIAKDCQETTEEEKEYAEIDECQCEEWESKEYDSYFYPVVMVSVMSYKFDEKGPDWIHEWGNEGMDYITIEEDTDTSAADDGEVSTWDYFSDGDEGEVDEFYINNEMQEDEVREDITTISAFLTPKPLKEQTEQMNLFPYGEWEFPVGWEKDDDYISDLKHNVPEDIFKKIFQLWDKNGIDFSIFKLVGVLPDTVTSTYVLKRYIQNTTKPIPVSYTFDCNDLAELFDTDHMDYDMGYVKEYLCGEDSFWDSQDWYNYEWENYMTDAIDENNWKTISEIFGGVPQSVAEDMLQENSSSEEVDELIEKYQEEIDEIQMFIVWAYNDEHEYAIKSRMGEDIKDKIADHFGADGKMVEDDRGAKGWLIKGDLRDWINDQWDNTDTYQYHEDYSSSPIEDWMLDMTINDNITNYIFGTLIEEEYRFWSYCEGKQGECLQPETKWFDGYWYPDIDINHSLADRLGELTSEPTIATQFAVADDETNPLQEAQEGKDGKDLEAQLNAQDGYEEYAPFTRSETGILNFLVKEFTMEELQTVAEIDDTQWPKGLYDKWSASLKLVGERTSDKESLGKSTRFARWVLDNYRDAGVEDLGDDSLDFKRMEGENAIKAWPSLYQITGTESGWEKIYRSGTIEIVGYDTEEVMDRAHEAFWDYEPDMETDDYGDYEADDDMEFEDPYHYKVLKENKDLNRMIERYTNHTCNLYELLVHQYNSVNKITRKQLKETMGNYIDSNSLDKNLLYLNEEEIISYLLNQGIIVEDKIKNSLIIEEPQTNNWWKNLPKKEKKNILEHGLPPIDDEAPKEIPEFIKKLLVVAKFTSAGTWGVAPSTFLLYMKPNGQVMYVKKSASLNNVPEQFTVGNTVSFGDLLNFENNSRYDLTMKGNIRETYLSTGRTIREKHTIPVTPQKQFYLKSLLKEMKNDNIEDLLRLAKDTKTGWQGGPGRKRVFEFLTKLRDSGLINMYQATDFLWSGSRWMRKYIDLHQPDSLEPIDEYEDDDRTIQHKETIQYLLDNADDVRDVIISNVIAKAELKGDTSLEGANRLMRPAAMDMVKLWAGQLAG